MEENPQKYNKYHSTETIMLTSQYFIIYKIIKCAEVCAPTQTRGLQTNLQII